MGLEEASSQELCPGLSCRGVGGRDRVSRVLTYCRPGCVLTGSWIGGGAATQPWTCQFGVQDVLLPLTASPLGFFDLFFSFNETSRIVFYLFYFFKVKTDGEHLKYKMNKEDSYFTSRAK